MIRSRLRRISRSTRIRLDSWFSSCGVSRRSDRARQGAPQPGLVRDAGKPVFLSSRRGRPAEQDQTRLKRRRQSDGHLRGDASAAAADHDDIARRQVPAASLPRTRRRVGFELDDRAALPVQADFVGPRL